MTLKTIIKRTLILALICTICTAILATVNAVTKEPIAQSKTRRILEAARKVLPDGAAPVATTRVIAGTTNTCFVVRDADGTITAVAVQGTAPKGYGGPVSIMFGIAADGTLLNYEVTQQTETPGLGSKIEEEPFRSHVLKRADGTSRPTMGTTWRVTRDGGDIEAVTAATISSRAALQALQNALATYETLKDTL